MLRTLAAMLLRQCFTDAQREFIAFHASAPAPHEWTWCGCGHPSTWTMLAASRRGAIVFIHRDELRSIRHLFRPGFRLRRIGLALAWCVARPPTAPIDSERAHARGRGVKTGRRILCGPFALDISQIFSGRNFR